MALKLHRLHLDSGPIGYQTSGAAGLDLSTPFQAVLWPFVPVWLPTGYQVALPDGYEMNIRPRSSFSLKQGVLVHCGTIDSDYRGEVKVLLLNFRPWPRLIRRHQRIAQGVISRVERLDLKFVSGLDMTGRGDGGFGSTN